MADDVVSPDTGSVGTTGLGGAMTVQPGPAKIADGAPRGGLPDTPKNEDENHPFSDEARRELERTVAAFRADIIRKAIRAKRDVRSDVVSAYNVKMAATGPTRPTQALAVRVTGMASNVLLGAVFGALVSLLTAPSPDGIKPLTVLCLFVMTTIGAVGAVWQLMHD